LSPDPASAKAGQGLANARKWVSTGRSERLVWGECQGSGAKPYQVQFDLDESSSKCSCPSRKFPCKHVLGLMLLFSASPQAVGSQAVPAWVEEWVAGRAERARKKQEKAEAPPKPVDEEAQAERREKRLSRVSIGLAALKTWAEDLVRSGIATVPGKGYAFFDEPARRMIDAQAPGVARRVQKLGEIASSGAGWQQPFMEQLASLYLLIRAFEGIAELPEPTQQDVLSTAGLPPTSDDPSTFAAVRDVWQIIAQDVVTEDRIRAQRTWLFGRDSKRPALVLAFAHGTSPLDTTLAPGMSFEGEMAFYPGNGTRAVVRSRGGLQPLQELRVFLTVTDLCDLTSEWFAKQPWMDEVPVALCRVIPIRSESSWILADSQRRALPTAMSDEAGWLAMAMSGGEPIDVAGVYDGRRLRPLALMAGGEYVSLVNVNPEGKWASSTT
jgi:hypothetical protein